MNNNLRSLLSEIDLTKSPNSNFPYLSRENIRDRLPTDEFDNLPVEAEKSEWRVETDMLSRVFHVDNRDHFAYFVSNVLEHASKIGHDPVMILRYPNISIKLKTHDLDEVTELDLELSKFIDEIYEDITFISEEF